MCWICVQSFVRVDVNNHIADWPAICFLDLMLQLKYMLHGFLFTDQLHITRISGNQSVKEKSKGILNCTADGNPTPKITWTRLSDNSVVTFPLTITGKQDEGVYECTADNGIGTPATAVVSIAVESKYNSILEQ